jgi:2-oxo-3-hexenedioate decarboxylase
MLTVEPNVLARELADAYAHRQSIAVPPSARDGGFDLSTAYAVEAELVRLRRASGHAPVGRKVGYANKAVWRVMKLDTLVWAHMYDDTVQHAERNTAELSLGRMYSPKIEPEIVLKMRGAIEGDRTDAAAVLAAVEWIALGFEVIDCVFADWKFQASDFVAAYGLHAALIVGTPLPVDAERIPDLVERLPSFRVALSKDGQVVQEGSGKNSLRSPALCVGELASAIERQPGASPLTAGELISSGTLTESQFIAPGETWTARVDGLDLPELTLRTVGQA